MDEIQANPSQTSHIPVNHGLFAKEPLNFPEINPQSKLVQKYLQTNPLFSILAPELF
jgi:hypothetical protein